MMGRAARGAAEFVQLGGDSEVRTDGCFALFVNTCASVPIFLCFSLFHNYTLELDMI